LTRNITCDALRAVHGLDKNFQNVLKAHEDTSYLDSSEKN